jgi:ABC-2 type transport system permease protein
MRAKRVLAVVRRDLHLVARAKAVVLPLIIVPLLFLVAFPALAGLAPRFVPADADLGDFEPFLEALPAERVAALPAEAGLAGAYLFVTYVFAPMVLLVPVMFAAVIAADAVAGERERGTLEGLLLSPLTDRELAAGKLLSAWIPAATVGVLGATVYALTANLSVGVQMGRAILPTVEFALLGLWVGPTVAAAALGAVVLVSARTNTFQEAFQIGGVVVLPVVGLIVAQATGLLLLSPWFLVGAGAVSLLIAWGTVGAAANALTRTRMGPRLG